MARKDYSGQRFGKLTVLSIAGQTKRGNTTFHCACECGVHLVVAGGHFSPKHPPRKSCGKCYHPNQFNFDPNRTSRICPSCKTDKVLILFPPCRGTPDGRASYCKKCKPLVDRKYRKRYRARETSYVRLKRQTDVRIKLESNLRRRINDALNGRRKGSTLVSLLGCSIGELRHHLESLWQPGMSWENYGVYRTGGPMTWHIDHIKPCASFDLTDPEQQKICFHWSNLQPLWAVDNMQKSDSVTYIETTLRAVKAP